jgi:quercetin dioxygenase-like cupin family protein
MVATGQFAARADDEMRSLGGRLRALRAEQGITLAQLGQMVGLSPSYLSQIERDKASPSLVTLSSIAETLGVELRSFFEHPSPTWQVVRQGDGEKLSAGQTGAVFEVLSSSAVRGKIEPCKVTFHPAMMTERESHPGEEFIFVLDGQLEIGVGEESFMLKRGDSIHYRASQPHYWRNSGTEQCSVVWAVSPPFVSGEEIRHHGLREGDR